MRGDNSKQKKPSDKLEDSQPTLKKKSRRQRTAVAEPGNVRGSMLEENISEMEQLQTANLKRPTETMEVHHHPEVERKIFKQYVLEGLMIFLAVFMGFIAEN